VFPGFDLPSANFTYTPNQFFDVCLPHYSRGVVRLVAYMIRQTLGWCDEDGNPLVERVRVSYRELEERAGIGHSMIRQALDEAIAGNFLRCVRSGSPNRVGERYTSSQFELRWDSGDQYLKDPKEFRGFFEGEGNRTNIPNQFFDVVVRNESLSTIKVVGSVIRFSIGFQTPKGGRRQRVSLSYRDVANYARLRSPRHLSSALQEALSAGYIQRVEQGVFDPEAGKRSKAATYAVRWYGEASYSENTPKREADLTLVQRSEKGSGNAPKREAERRSEKGSGIQRTRSNNTIKQQQAPEGAAAAGSVGAVQALRSAGFDDRAARELADAHSADTISRQLAWLAKRAPKRNPLGLLRRAIEEDWPEPAAMADVAEDSPAALFARRFYAAFGGNSGEPVASPSATDLASSQRFVERLLEVWSSPELSPKWGEAFARLCLERTERRRPGIVSFSAMLRSYGDEFFVRQQQGRANQLKTATAQERERYEAEHRAAWEVYVAETETRFRTERPEDFARFLAHREGERRRIAESPYQGARERALAYLDSDEARLKDFQEFFSHEVRDFWKWDEARKSEEMAAGMT
jgi:hypothetical protein